jgi:hypothetical protein
VAYLVVDDLAAKMDEVEAAGGRVLVRTMPFAGGGEIGLFADPDGNVLGLWQRKNAGGGGAAAAGGASAEAAKVPGKAPAKAAKPASKPKKKK